MPVIASPSGFTPWTALVPFVAPKVPECPTPAIRQALIEAAREFFAASRCWRMRDITLLTTVAGQNTYAYNSPTNGQLCQVLTAYRGSEEIDVEQPGEGDDDEPGKTDGDYRIAMSDDASGFEVRPAPMLAGEVLKGSIALTTAENADGILTWVFRDYRQQIAMGAAAMLVIEPNKPWTAPALYDGYRREFEAAVALASNQAGPVRRRGLRVKPSVI